MVAAGVESMSIVTMGSSVTLAMKAGMPAPFGTGWRERYGDQEISQFRGAQLICEQWGFKRSQLEESPWRATSARSAPSTRAGSSPDSAA